MQEPIMTRFPILAVAVLLCIGSLSCQQYSSGLQQSASRADETSATGALRTIVLAQQTYAATHEGNYGTFQQLSDAGYLDERFKSSQPTIKDYVLSMEVGKKADGPYYNCRADPVNAGERNGRHFFIDGSTILRVNATQPATASDPAFQP
jgi:hypothetical protein